MQNHGVHVAIPGEILAAVFDVGLVHAHGHVLLVVFIGALQHQVDGLAFAGWRGQGGDQGVVFINDGQLGGGKSCGHGVLSTNEWMTPP